MFDGEGELYDCYGQILYEGEFRNDKPCDISKIIKNSKTYNYASLMRKTNNTRNLIELTGYVTDVFESECYTDYILSSGNSDENTYYLVDSKSKDNKKIVIGNYIKVYGLSDGFINFEISESSFSKLPYVEVYYIEVK